VGLVVKNDNVEGAGVHALIVGVSDYLNLPEAGEPSSDETWNLNKLSSPALSALKIFDFITKTGLRLPLKTVRLLLSPSPAEVQVEPRLANATPTRASRDAFFKLAVEWRKDASNNPEDMTFFYFAGHGTQRGSEDSVLMLEDFLTSDAPLNECFEMHNLKSGMAPTATRPNIALTQFYFVDACMDRNAKLRSFLNPTVPPVFGIELSGKDKRAAPLIYSTVDGAFALGRSGKVSHFAEALTLALNRGAEEPDEETGQWPVTATTIKNALDFYYTKNNLGTLVTMGSLVGSPVIRYLAGPPDIDISVEVQPDSLGLPCAIGVLDQNNAAVAGCNPGAKTKFGLTVQAGVYRVEVNAGRLTSNPFRSAPRPFMKPTLKPWTHNLASLLRPQN
jgi:Caspase domain